MRRALRACSLLAHYCLLPIAYCLLLTAYFSIPIFAQDEPPPPPPPSAVRQKEDGVETVRVDTELVDLNVAVFSRETKRPVGELRQEDFAVMEDGSAEEISFFASSAAPFDLVLLLDLSGSTADKLDLVKKSAIRFAQAARPGDRVGVIAFTDSLYVISAPTPDRQQLVESIKKMERPRGGTNFWDALRFVLKKTFAARDPSRRQAVVVLSDGVDNALPEVLGPGSTVTYEDLLEDVKASDVIVIPVYLDTEREMLKKHMATEGAYVLARQQLAELAAESGSILYRARKLEDLKGVYEQVIADLGTVYSIGYRPTNRKRDGSWRAVSVRLVNHPELAARTRRGYYAK